MTCLCGCGGIPKTPGRKYCSGHNPHYTHSKETRQRLAEIVSAAWARNPQRRKAQAVRNRSSVHARAVREGIARSEKRKAASHRRRGRQNSNWKGGRILRWGYVWVRSPIGHPRQGYVPEQVLIAEKVLGRCLRRFGMNHPLNEEVHHINQQRSDNRNENLLVCTRQYHLALHVRMRARDRGRRG